MFLHKVNISADVFSQSIVNSSNIGVLFAYFDLGEGSGTGLGELWGMTLRKKSILGRTLVVGGVIWVAQKGILPGARCPVPGARCRVPGAWCPVPGARCPVPGARCLVPGARCPAQELYYSGSHVRFSRDKKNTPKRRMRSVHYIRHLVRVRCDPITNNSVWWRPYETLYIVYGSHLTLTEYCK